MLSAEQIAYVKRQLREWDAVTQRAGYDSPIGDALADIDHSALLERLLAGDAPLPLPPPQSFSYPWYDLFDQGSADHCDVSVWPDLEPDLVVINQYRWLPVLISRDTGGAPVDIVAYDRRSQTHVRCTRQPTVPAPFNWRVEIIPPPE